MQEQQIIMNIIKFVLLIYELFQELSDFILLEIEGSSAIPIAIPISARGN